VLTVGDTIFGSINVFILPINKKQININVLFILKMKFNSSQILKETLVYCLSNNFTNNRIHRINTITIISCLSK
jgi:hypothetical protein